MYLIYLATILATSVSANVLNTNVIEIPTNSQWQIQPAVVPEQAPVDSDWMPARASDWRHMGFHQQNAQSPAWVKQTRAEINSLWYRTTITLPQDWIGQRIMADFVRLEGDAIIFLNGKRLGELQRPGGFFELTSEAHGRDNELLVFVTRDYTGISRGFEQDKLRYLARHVRSELPTERWPMGITAPIILHCWGNPVSVSDIFIQTSWQKKQLQLQIQLDALKTTEALSIHAIVKDAQGQTILQLNQPVASISQGNHSVTITHDWANPIPWQLDGPYLYTLELSLFQGQKTLQQVPPITFGFREITVEGKDIFINGQRSPWRLGSSVGGMSLGALSLYRMAGRNVIYYQPHAKQWWRDWNESPLFDQAILDEADQTGTGILLPAVQVDHLREDLLSDPQVLKAYERELAIHLRRYQNHPSVLAWSLGMNIINPRNAIHAQTLGQRCDYHMPQESVLKKAFACVKSIDPSRLVYSHADGNFGDIATANLYTNFAPIQEREDWLKTWSQKGDMPYMAVECGNAFLANYIKQNQVLITEYLAMQLGPKAYETETPEALAIITPGTTSRWNTIAFLAPFYDAFWQVQRRDVTLFDRAWRTWGESAGHFPWDFVLGFGTPPGPKKNSVYRYEVLKNTLTDIPDWVNENFHIHRQTMQPLLAYIAGSPRHTDKTHSYLAGQTITKQLAIVWDGPGSRDFSALWQLVNVTTQQVLTSGEMDLLLSPGSITLKPIACTAPQITQRTSLQLRMTLRQGNTTVAEDQFDLNIFPNPKPRQRTQQAWLWDPQNQSRWVKQRMPQVKVFDSQSQPANTWQADDLLIIGRQALTDQHRLPFTHQDIASGLRVLILEQKSQDWETLGLKADETYTRRTYVIDKQHPIMQGLEPADLINWTGDSDLLPDDRQARSRDTPRYPRVDNLHIVAPVVLQIPERVGFEPILVSGFDLNEATLMQWRFGKGSILFCTLALSERLNSPTPDPVVVRLTDNLLDMACTHTTPTRQTQMLGDPALAKQLGLASAASVDALEISDASTRLWVIATSSPNTLPADKAQSFLAAGGRIAYLQASAEQLQAMGYAVSRQTLRKVSDHTDWPKSLSLNLARWRDALEITTFNLQGQPANSHVMGKGIALEQDHSAGKILFLQVTPSLLADKPNVNPQQRQSTQLSLVRLLQLDAQWLSHFEAGCDPDIAKRLTTIQAGPEFKWLKHWNLLGPIPAAKANASPEDLYTQTFAGMQEAIDGNINPNFTYRQTNGHILDFRPTALADETGFVDLLRPLGKGEGYLAMATTTLQADQAHAAILRLGVDFWCQVYVNGKLTFQTSGGPGAPQPNKHRVRIKLNAGENIITFKVLPGSKGFGFWANVSKSESTATPSQQGQREPDVSFYTPLPYPFDPYEYHYW